MGAEPARNEDVVVDVAVDDNGRCSMLEEEPIMKWLTTLFCILGALALVACGGTSSDGDGDADADVDGDGDADSDIDSDADGDVDGDADGDIDGDVDGDIDGDADGDVDGDADGDIDGDSDGDADTEGCEAQEAAPEGGCATVLPGVLWNGTNCVGLGSGCSCTGADCGDLYDTLEACVDARRDCYDPSCEPAPVSDDLCWDCTDEMFLGAFWNGRECFELRGCACHGDGCDRAYASVPECNLVHSRCDATLCRATGGDWYPGHPCGPCGHYICGEESGDDCCAAGCDCGPNRSFVAGEGCRADGTCTPAQACRATDGIWHPAADCICGFTCGRRNDCEACLDSCDCGGHRNFDPARGCVVDDSCARVEHEEVCTSTGGRWHDGDEGCGDFHCGVPNLLDPCVMPGCDCGTTHNFDPSVGCIFDEGCVLRTLDQECHGGGRSSTCRPGLVCCSTCGVFPGCMTCEIPCCDDSPACEADGCFPPPP